MLALAPLWIALSLRLRRRRRRRARIPAVHGGHGIQQSDCDRIPPRRANLGNRAGGALKLVDNGAVTTLIDIPVAMCFDYETGLLGIVVDPDFANNGYVYLYRTKLGTFDCFDPNQRFNEIVRIVIGANDTVDIGSLTVLLTGIETDTGYHDGGALRLGPDGHLYAGTGETGQGISAAARRGPPRIPMRSRSTRSKARSSASRATDRFPTIILSLGFRGAAGDLCVRLPQPVADGVRSDRRRAVGGRRGRGGHGGGRPREAGRQLRLAPQRGKVAEGGPRHGRPVLTYLHEGAKSLGSCVSGVGFAPPGFGYFGGFLFFGDFDGGHIYRVALDKTRKKTVGAPVIFANNTDGITDLVFGPDGALYYLSLNTGSCARSRRLGAGASSRWREVAELEVQRQSQE